MTSDHLIPEAARMLELSVSARFAFIERDKLIETPAYLSATRRFDELYTHHDVLRPPNLALYGPSGIGKSHVVADYVRRRPARRSPKTHILSVPVLLFEFPPIADERWLIEVLSKNLGYPTALPRRRSDAYGGVVNRLESSRTRLIIGEEASRVLEWPYTEQRKVAGFLRWLSNQARIPIVLVGSEELPQLIASDVQLVRRFEHFALPTWQADNDFAGFVQAYVATLPLRKPSVIDRKMVERLHEASEGITHNLVRLLQRAAKQAILDGSEQVLLKHIGEDAFMVPPTASARKAARRRQRR